METANGEPFRAEAEPSETAAPRETVGDDVSRGKDGVSRARGPSFARKLWRAGDEDNGKKENDGVTKRDNPGQSGDGLEEQGVGRWNVSRNRVKQR
jgi:hypothetical protein